MYRVKYYDYWNGYCSVYAYEYGFVDLVEAETRADELRKQNYLQVSVERY